MKIWTEQPDRTEAEAVIRDYFSLLRAGKTDDAAQLVDHTPVRHVLKALWVGSVGASADVDLDDVLAAGEWEQDLSWLRELDLGAFDWGPTGSHVYVDVTYRAQAVEVALGFWLKPTDAGWVVSGPSTLW